MADIPSIAPGVVLRLTAGEWRGDPHATNQLPADDRTIVVAHVYNALVGGMVWLRGHLPGCDETCPRPCVEGQVTVAALHRHAEGQQ